VILGTRFEILGTRIWSLKRFKKTLGYSLLEVRVIRVKLAVISSSRHFRAWRKTCKTKNFKYAI